MEGEGMSLSIKSSVRWYRERIKQFGGRTRSLDLPLSGRWLLARGDLIILRRMFSGVVCHYWPAAHARALKLAGSTVIDC